MHIFLRLTSKMSHDRGWRAACGMTIWSPGFHFDYSYESTRRDGHGRWLWRLVRPVFSRLKLHRGVAIAIEADDLLLRTQITTNVATEMRLKSHLGHGGALHDQISSEHDLLLSAWGRIA